MGFEDVIQRKKIKASYYATMIEWLFVQIHDDSVVVFWERTLSKDLLLHL